MEGLTHVDDSGHARLVDVSARERTVRAATATGRVVTTPVVLHVSAEGRLPKGDVGAVARIAGIQAAKQTPQLVPLCHPIALHGVEVEIAVDHPAAAVTIAAHVRTVDRTGVEMEALTAVAVAGLAVIDMIKSLDPAACLSDVAVEAKDGGRSGAWRRPEVR